MIYSGRDQVTVLLIQNGANVNLSDKEVSFVFHFFSGSLSSSIFNWIFFLGMVSVTFSSVEWKQSNCNGVDFNFSVAIKYLQNVIVSGDGTY